MIPKESLRIGNIVDYELTTHVVKELHDKIVLHVWQDADNHFGSYESISGIPLTEEWLTGWEKGPGWLATGDAFKAPLESDAFHLVRTTGGRWLAYWEMECIIAIQYVHQLQNLYFALTGVELQLFEKSNGPAT